MTVKKDHGKPVPVRFSDEQMRDIQQTAESLQMSQAEVIRLAVSAGCKALNKVGRQGLLDMLAKAIIPILLVALLFPAKAKAVFATILALVS